MNVADGAPFWLDPPQAGTAVPPVFRDAVPGGSLDGPVDSSPCQYLVPSRSGVVVVTGATPVLPLAELLPDLVDAIADSFTFTAEDSACAPLVLG